MNQLPTLIEAIRQGARAALPALIFLLSHGAYGQTDLRSLLSLAEAHYPTIAARQAEAEAVRVNMALEKNTLLPALDAAYQVNYSTYNNITGMNYPGLLIPISGPPSTENFNNPVPGSAASLLARWSPITFGQRAAAIEYHEKVYEKHLASVADEVLRVQFRVAFLYLEIAATQALIETFEKNMERSAFNLSQVSSLVAAGIRPGVDSLKFKGELSKARTELFKFENLLETQKHELQELLASDVLPVIEANAFFVGNLPAEPGAAASGEHPRLAIAQLEVEASQVRLKQIHRSWTPEIDVWGTAYARGSGIRFDGTVEKAEGWTFSRYNYGIGLQVAFPILDRPAIKLKSSQQEASIRSSESQLRHTRLALNKEAAIAEQDLKTALLIAGEAPVEYAASESAFEALQTRYQAGLIDYSELILAQYDLLHAEASLKNAHVSAWKSLLKLAVISGDMNLFLNQIPN